MTIDIKDIKRHDIVDMIGHTVSVVLSVEDTGDGILMHWIAPSHLLVGNWDGPKTVLPYDFPIKRSNVIGLVKDFFRGVRRMIVRKLTGKEVW